MKNNTNTIPGQPQYTRSNWGQAPWQLADGCEAAAQAHQVLHPWTRCGDVTPEQIAATQGHSIADCYTPMTFAQCFALCSALLDQERTRLQDAAHQLRRQKARARRERRERAQAGQAWDRFVQQEAARLGI